MLKTVDAVCDEMGNTRGICEEHYINKLVTKEAAEAWFSVMPDNQDIIPMPAASNEINQSELPAAARAITANG